MRSRISVALLLGALAFAPGIASAADETHSLEQLVVDMAHTPADHAALARHYRAQAAEARANAANHEGMGRAYGGGKFAERQRMQEHCKKLSADNAAMATEFDALAQLHEEASKKTQ